MIKNNTLAKRMESRSCYYATRTTKRGGCHQIGDARPFSFSRMSCVLSYGTIGGLQNPGVLLAVALTSPENIIELKIMRKLPVGCPRHCG